MTPYEVFELTLKVGEKTLGVTYSNYQDAFSFAMKCFNGMSHHLIDYFTNHSNLEKGSYELDLLRYYYVKTIEHRISSDYYADTTRGNVCDLFLSPFDISLSDYPTNLPKHLEMIVNSHQEEARNLAQSVLDSVISQGKTIDENVLNAVAFLGHTVGYHIGKESRLYQSYDCSEMLTRNELSQISGVNMCKWLQNSGYVILQTNYSRETPYSIVAEKDGKQYMILIAEEIAPVRPGFRGEDLGALYDAAHSSDAVPYYACVSLGSNNEEHFRKGVLLNGDSVRFRVDAFGELEKGD